MRCRATIEVSAPGRYQEGTDRLVDESQLREKLRRIEALHAGAATAGERDAAEAAHQRILKRLEELLSFDPPIEYRFTLGDQWKKKLFLALCRRYGLEPYRRRGQRWTTVMVRVPQSFVDETLWPEFDELAGVLTEYLREVTDRVITESINADISEEREEPSPGLLGQ